MPRCLVRLERYGVERFLVWSTVPDAPVTRGLSDDELTEHFRREGGLEALRDLPARIERARKCGTSMQDGQSAEEVCLPNRAGPRERSLSLEELWDAYCDPDSATRAIDAVIADLCRLQGLKQAWESIEPGRQSEIRAQWAELIRAESRRTATM